MVERRSPAGVDILRGGGVARSADSGRRGRNNSIVTGDPAGLYGAVASQRVATTGPDRGNVRAQQREHELLIAGLLLHACGGCWRSAETPRWSGLRARACRQTPGEARNEPRSNDTKSRRRNWSDQRWTCGLEEMRRAAALLFLLWPRAWEGGVGSRTVALVWWFWSILVWVR